MYVYPEFPIGNKGGSGEQEQGREVDQGLRGRCNTSYKHMQRDL